MRNNLRTGQAYMDCLQAISERMVSDREAGETVNDYVILYRHGRYRSITVKLREATKKKGRRGWVPVVVVTKAGELRSPWRALE